MGEKKPKNAVENSFNKDPRKADDIMAECLLRGGKMLSRSCRACGSPLFEVKGETLCIVCRDQGKEPATGEAAAPAGTPAQAEKVTGAGAVAAGPGDEPDEERELRLSIAALARRAREETDPDRCRALMEAARNGALALSFLQR